MTKEVIIEIKRLLVEKTPNLTPEQKSMMYKIINPDISNYVKYGVKVAEIENIVKNVYNKFICTYQDAIEVFKRLTKSNVEEEKFAAFFFLNRFKKILMRKLLTFSEKNTLNIAIHGVTVIALASES